MGDMTVYDGAEAQEGSAPAPDVGIKASTFRMFLEECRYQPSWRNMADKCADYHDGNQLDQETLAELERRGMGPLQRNIIQPLVNVVLGMEAKTRTDWRVSGDNDQVQQVAEAMSAKLHEAERETRADKACSDAYAGQIKAGLGWVEVSRNMDPFGYPYNACALHRRELWWDWRDDSPDLSKSRFQLRKRWFDADQAASYFPKASELIFAAVSGDPNRYEMMVAKRGLELGMSLDEVRDVDIDDYEEWRSYERRRVCLYEVWYRVFVRGYVAKLPNGQVVELDTKNPVHVALLSRGAIRAQQAVYSKLRMAMMVGPHKLMDCACSKRHTPYVPFWGYREDRTGVPYGLIRSMISPQDEVNARLQKMMWLLGAKRVEMDSDALDQKLQSPQDMLDELARPDAVVFRNPNRRNLQNGIQINDNLTLADAQFKVLQDAMQAAQQVVGVFNAMLGRESQSSSGLAINSLVEQGMTTLAEINDNYRYARRLVGERLLDLIQDDMIGQQVDVIVGEVGRKRVISINQPVRMQHPDTGEIVETVKNDLRAARLKVALDDVPSSAAYREQQFTMLAEMTKGLPPQLQAVIAPFIMEASDLQRRREMADALRKAMGVPTPKTPEEEQAMEAQQQQAMAFAQDIQRRQALAEIAEREAKVEKLKAEAAKAMAEVQGNPALAGAQAEHALRVKQIEDRARGEIDNITAKLMQVRMDSAKREQILLAKLSEAVATLKANAGSADAERRKAEIEKEIAQINADKEREVAKLQSDSQRTQEALTSELQSLRDELLKKIEQSEAKTQKAVEKVETKVEKSAADAAKRETREDKQEGGGQAAAPVTVVLGGGEQEIEISPDGKGGFKGVKRPRKQVKK